MRDRQIYNMPKNKVIWHKFGCSAARQNGAANTASFSLNLALPMHTQSVMPGVRQKQSAGLPLCLRGSCLAIARPTKKSAPVLSVGCPPSPPLAALLLIITCNKHSSCGLKKSNFPLIIISPHFRGDQLQLCGFAQCSIELCPCAGLSPHR